MLQLFQKTVADRYDRRIRNKLAQESNSETKTRWFVHFNTYLNDFLCASDLSRVSRCCTVEWTFSKQSARRHSPPSRRTTRAWPTQNDFSSSPMENRRPNYPRCYFVNIFPPLSEKLSKLNPTRCALLTASTANFWGVVK